MRGKYNGHKNWAHWNVSLWINNDEGLYMLAKAVMKGYSGSRKAQARGVLLELHEMGITHTPDGARYSETSILAALRGL